MLPYGVPIGNPRFAADPGHSFKLHDGPDAHRDRLRVRWALRADGNQPIAIGLDVAELAPDGRMRRVTGFLDPAS